MSNRVERSAHPAFDGGSWYVYGLWNLTGENSTYKNGVLGNVAPANPARGMWQLGLRSDEADLNSGAVHGGKESNWTLGVNYYWRNNFKFSLNHVAVTSEKGLIPIQDDPTITEFRAQLYW